jgi:hypothetical protein
MKRNNYSIIKYRTNFFHAYNMVHALFSMEPEIFFRWKLYTK